GLHGPAGLGDLQRTVAAVGLDRTGRLLHRHRADGGGDAHVPSRLGDPDGAVAGLGGYVPPLIGHGDGPDAGADVRGAAQPVEAPRPVAGPDRAAVGLRDTDDEGTGPPDALRVLGGLGGDRQHPVVPPADLDFDVRETGHGLFLAVAEGGDLGGHL